VVAGVTSLAEASAQIAAGFVVLGLERGGGIVCTSRSTSCFYGRLAGGEFIIVMLRHPLVLIPYHSSARTAPPSFRFRAPQKRDLQNECSTAAVAGGQRFQGEAAAPSCCTSTGGDESCFQGKMRVDTMTPLWLDKDQIAA